MYRILIAEDNNINIKVAEFTLKPIASQIHSVKNGQKALEILETESFDVILMDVKMPVMDGYEATRKIRLLEEQGKVNSMAIIATTANNQPEDIALCKEVGMDDFISKPFTTDQIKDIIETAISKKNL